MVTPSAQDDKDPDRSYTAAVDLWALGEVVFRMLAHQPAFKNSYELFRFAEGKTSLDAQKQILVDKSVGEGGLDFICKLLVISPSLRMSANEATAHPWLQTAAPSSHSTSRASSP